ncbi:hypothetical protein [Glycomyces sp. NPDC047010]|uniref:hypothetical protein n=1 Tax=Glycomyces sp. NPDC047010 TaxID=3155023 RepID=UPI0034085620
MTVWTVENPADLVVGLVTELAPTGPVAAVDLPGWTALPEAGRITRVYARSRASANRALATLAGKTQRRVRVQAACESTLAAKLGAEQRLGMVCASAWLLHCPGGRDAAIAALRPGGVLAVAGKSDRDAVDIATLVDNDPTGHGRSLTFAAYLVAAMPAVLDAAAEAERGLSARHSAIRGHWGVGVWCKNPTRSGGARA